MNTCDDCEIPIITEKDEMAFFSNSRCARCEALMFAAMEEAEQDEKVRANTF